MTKWRRYKRRVRTLRRLYEEARRRPVNVMAFGAQRDNNTDTSAGIQRAVDFAAKHHDQVGFPPGVWTIEKPISLRSPEEGE